MKELIDSYIKFLKDNIVLNQVGEYTSVITPFLNKHNDCIKFYIKKTENGEIYITDNGDIIDDLKSYGTYFSFDMLRTILTTYHLQINDNEEFFTKTSIQNFPHAIHLFIQAIIFINNNAYE